MLLDICNFFLIIGIIGFVYGVVGYFKSSKKYSSNDDYDYKYHLENGRFSIKPVKKSNK